MMKIFPQEIAFKLSADPDIVREIVSDELQMTEDMQEAFIKALTDVTIRLSVQADGSFAIRYWKFNLDS